MNIVNRQLNWEARQMTYINSSLNKLTLYKGNTWLYIYIYITHLHHYYFIQIHCALVPGVYTYFSLTFVIGIGGGKENRHKTHKKTSTKIDKLIMSILSTNFSID